MIQCNSIEAYYHMCIRADVVLCVPSVQYCLQRDDLLSLRLCLSASVSGSASSTQYWSQITPNPQRS